MHRVLFSIGNLTIYSYGIMLAVGFIIAAFVARQRFIEHYKDPDIILDFVLAAVVGGIVGARLAYVIGHWSEFSHNTGKIFALNMEGLVFYGGLALGLVFALAVAYVKKVRLWTMLDLAGLCVPIALAIGRIGCLLNGCCYGKPTSLPWGITYPVSTGIIGARHPTQIYELILDLVLFGLLWWKRDSFELEGTIFWLFVMGYGLIRFTVEFYREHAQSFAGIGFQAGSIAMVVIAGLVLLFRYRLLPSAGGERL